MRWEGLESGSGSRSERCCGCWARWRCPDWGWPLQPPPRCPLSSVWQRGSTPLLSCYSCPGGCRPGCQPGWRGGCRRGGPEPRRRRCCRSRPLPGTLPAPCQLTRRVTRAALHGHCCQPWGWRRLLGSWRGPPAALGATWGSAACSRPLQARAAGAAVAGWEVPQVCDRQIEEAPDGHGTALFALNPRHAHHGNGTADTAWRARQRVPGPIQCLNTIYPPGCRAGTW